MLWNQFLAFVQTSKGWGVLGLVAIALYTLYLNWGRVQASGWLPGFLGGTTGGVTSKDIPSRREVIDYLDACYNYFEDVGCEEGKKAVSDAVNHAFHEHPPAASKEQEASLNDLANVVLKALQRNQQPLNKSGGLEASAPVVAAAAPVTETSSSPEQHHE